MVPRSVVRVCVSPALTEVEEAVSNVPAVTETVKGPRWGSARVGRVQRPGPSHVAGADQWNLSRCGEAGGSRCGRWTMPLVNQQAPDESDYSLVACLDNVRNLSTVLKAIHFREHATCFATKNGIKVTVENAKCVQANAFIQVCEWTPLSGDIDSPHPV